MSSHTATDTAYLKPPALAALAVLALALVVPAQLAAAHTQVTQPPLLVSGTVACLQRGTVPGGHRMLLRQQVATDTPSGVSWDAPHCDPVSEP